VTTWENVTGTNTNHLPAMMDMASSNKVSWDDDLSITSPSDERHNIQSSRDDCDGSPTATANNDDDIVLAIVNTDELESSSSMILLEVEDIEDELRGFFWPENRE
jgi:hypothetical protein